MDMLGSFTHIRQDTVEDVGGWTWIKTDTGAWVGPKLDWENSHKGNITQFCKKFDVVITAGGNHGMYARLLANMFGLVYTFEPDPLNFHCLVNNCQLDRIVKIQAALGDTHKMVAVQQVTMENTGMHRVHDCGHIPMLKLDDFEFQTLDYIQLDTEGYEMAILRGASNIINQHKPLISTENGCDEIERYLAPLGYRVVAQSVSDRFYSI